MSAMTELRSADLGEILARVEKASGPDRELDALIEVQVRRFQAYAVGLNDDTRAQWQASPDGLVHDPDSYYFAPDATSGIDAACESVQRALKVYSLRLTIDPSGNGAALTWWPDGLTGGRRIQAEAVSSDPPLAILAALLSALLSQESQDDHKL